MTAPAIDALVAAALRPQRRISAVAMASAVAAAIAGVLLLGLSGWFITGAALAGAGGITAVQAFNYLLPSAAIRGLAIIRTVGRYGERLASHRAALLALATLRASLFARIIGTSNAAALTLGAGDAAARLVQDVDTLEDLIVRRPALPVALTAGLLALGLAGVAGWRAMAGLALVLVIVPALAFRFGPRLLDGPAARLQTANAALKQDFVDYATAAAELRAYDLGGEITSILEARATRVDAAHRQLARGEALLAALLTVAGGIAVAIPMALSTATLPWTVLSALAAGAAVEALAPAVRGLARRSLVAASEVRLSTLLLAAPAATSGRSLSGRQLVIAAGGGSVVLQPGDRLAIAGPSGSGKTRLLESLAGLRPDVAPGRFVDGVGLDGLGIERLRPLFALSPQNAQMIAGTIADNLRLARPRVSEADMWAALGVACLDGDVGAMPAQLDSWIGDGGARLSGGQRKRLSLARALLAGRPWLLLDEPSEGLDPGTERRLVGQLGDWLGATGTGLIVASHRPALWALAPRRLELQAVPGHAVCEVGA